MFYPEQVNDFVVTYGTIVLGTIGVLAAIGYFYNKHKTKKFMKEAI